MFVNIAEDIKPVSYIKSNASDVMDYVYVVNWFHFF